jgi:hypothetical protein
MSEELVVQNTSAITIRAELDTQIATANAYPRDERKCLEKATFMATLDEETAQSCFYALPRKDKNKNNIIIEGESIRLAEIMRASWGHMHTQTRVVAVTERYIDTEAVAWDLQNNNKHIASDRISIWFGESGGKGGFRAGNDMQIVLAKASQAKALRNAIFQVIPKGMVKVVAKAAKQCAIGDTKALSSKVRYVVDRLVKMGLNQEVMLEYFGHSKIDDFTADDLETLIGVGTALKEGYIKPEQVFNLEEVGLNEKPKDRLNTLIAEAKPAPAQITNPSTGEVI